MPPPYRRHEPMTIPVDFVARCQPNGRSLGQQYGECRSGITHTLIPRSPTSSGIFISKQTEVTSSRPTGRVCQDGASVAEDQVLVPFVDSCRPIPQPAAAKQHRASVRMAGQEKAKCVCVLYGSRS